MKKTNFLDLGLLATRYGLNKEDLSYGLGLSKGSTFMAVLIKNKNFFINVFEHKFYPLELPYADIEIEKAELTDCGDFFLLHSSKIDLQIDKSEVEQSFADKYYSEATEKYVSGF